MRPVGQREDTPVDVKITEVNVQLHGRLVQKGYSATGYRLTVN